MRRPLPWLPTLGLILLHTAGHAQLKPDWTAATGPVDWMRITSAGALVVGTAEGLKGVDPKAGTVAWTVKELGGAPVDGYREVERTPFVSVAPNGHPEALFILEPFTGQVVFSSDAAGITNVTSTHFLYANEAIIVVGQDAGRKAVMACVDMGTGKVRWTKDDSFSRITACNSAGSDAILLSTLFFAYKLDSSTGAELWKRSPDPGFEKMSGMAALLDKGGANINLPGVHGVFLTTPHAPELCFMGMQTERRKETTDAQGKKTVTVTYSTFINAFRISDGSYAWAEPLRMPQQLGTLVPLKHGLLVGAGDNRSVDLLDYATGAGRWGKGGKGINVKGILAGAVEVDEHTLLTSTGSDGVVTLVDASGAEAWKKPVRLEGAVRRVALLGSAVLIASESELDMVELGTGLSRLEKPLQGGAGLLANGGGAFWALDARSGQLLRIDPADGTAKPVAVVQLGFEGKERPTQLEWTPQGLVASSDQNLALISPEGQLVYRRYHAAPRESGLTRALKYASAVRAAYYTAAFGYTSAAFGAASQSIQVQDAGSAAAKEVTGALSDVYGAGATAAAGATARFIQEANARFKASASTAETHYLMSEAEKGSYVLRALRKSDGAELGTVPLGRDRSPRYEVDAFTGSVYLATEKGVTVYH